MFHLKQRKMKGSRIKAICPLYKLPSHNTIERRIDDIYDVIAGDFRKTLSTVQYVAVTTDAWTETMQMKSFLNITLPTYNCRSSSGIK